MTKKTKKKTKKSTDKPKLVTVRATRNFNQMKRGQVELVDPKEKFWTDNLVSGNLEVVD